MAELAAWLSSLQAWATTEGVTAAAATAGGMQAAKSLPKPKGTAPLQPKPEAELSRFKQDQRDLLRKRRASVATHTRLEEPILGKQSLLGA